MLEIEWKSSHYHSDGRRRSRPKPSTVHGWLVKWRATFSGNERLRKQGIREMREAKALRERIQRKRQKKSARPTKAKSFFRLWPISVSKEERQSQVPKRSQHSSSKRPSRGSTRCLTFPNHPTPVNSQRPKQKAAPSSRKASYNYRGDAVQITEQKRRLTSPT